MDSTLVRTTRSALCFITVVAPTGGLPCLADAVETMTLDDLTDPLAAYVADFKHRRVLVLGDAILDEYLLGDCSRISPEAPVPVLKVNTSRRVLGGAANTAANIVSLGGRATLIALVGDDEGGERSEGTRLNSSHATLSRMPSSA